MSVNGKYDVIKGPDVEFIMYQYKKLLVCQAHIILIDLPDMLII